MARPFPRINLLSRKQKDQRSLAAANESPNGGDVIIRSKGKIANPNNPTQTLSRGAQVSVRPRTETVKHPDINTPAQYEDRQVPHTKETFKPGDSNPKIKDRETTIALGKQLRENPEKTATRIKVQRAMGSGGTPEQAGAKRIGDAIAYSHGKSKDEYAGRMEKSTEMKTERVMTAPAKTIPGRSETISRKQTIVHEHPMSPDQGLKRSRTAAHVPWLGSKSQTKGYTANPNTGGKTTTIWKKRSIKSH